MAKKCETLQDFFDNLDQSFEKQKKWDKRFIEIAKVVSTWSSCLSRHVGCVIVKDRRIITTGYNGAPAGIKSCVERGYCLRADSKSGDDLAHCYATHAEQNALLQAAKLGVSVDGATLYCTTKPCSTCTKMIINSGIKRVCYINEYPDNFAGELFRESNIEVIKL